MKRQALYVAHAGTDKPETDGWYKVTLAGDIHTEAQWVKDTWYHNAKGQGEVIEWLEPVGLNEYDYIKDQLLKRQSAKLLLFLFVGLLVGITIGILIASL